VGNYKKLRVEPGEKVRLARVDPADTSPFASREEAKPLIEKNIERMIKLQYLLYADGNRSLLVILQALDAGGKDGVVRRVFSGMNPQGVSVYNFKQPTSVELAHDFLWRVHPCVPGKGEVSIFNRSHYEDVLVVRIHKLVPTPVWTKRYELINDFEKNLSENGTGILKFYLHISPDEQLERFKQRLEDPMRQWKIREADYVERELWPQYLEAYEETLERTSTKHAPWYIIPADYKWFRDLAISQIIVDTLEGMNMNLPKAKVDLDEMRRKYHAARKKKHRLDQEIKKQR
jgi:PPK2 family polyphosphate:nucleotide phosphotransferase